MKTVGVSSMLLVLLGMNAGASGWGEEQAAGRAPANGPVWLFPVEVDKKWGYMDPAGNVVIAPQYEWAWDFSEGLACIQVGLLRGYIDFMGTLVIKPKFVWSGKFSGGRAAIFANVVPWGDFMMFYKQWGAWSYADTKGNRRNEWVQDSNCRPPDYRDCFAQGPAPRQKNNAARNNFSLWGYCDRSGQFVIEPQYEEAGAFADGLAPVAVRTEGQTPPEKRDWQWMQRRKIVWGFIDPAGKPVIEKKYGDAQPFSEGLASVRIGDKWGYVNKTGEAVVQARYDFAWPFSEGRGRVLLGEKHGYVDDKGQEIIKPQFDGAWEFSKGLARVIVGENEWYINPRGEYVWDEAKRNIHRQFLALRLEAAGGNRKEASAKYRAYLKERAAEAYVRRAGLAYLGSIVGAGAFEELCAAADDADPVMREIVTRALTTLSGDGVTQKLLARIGVVEDAKRATCLKVLGARGDKAGLAAVRENLKDRSEAVRVAALTALRPLAGVAASADLLEALKTGTPGERATAFRELGELPDKEATAALAAALPQAPVELRVDMLRRLARFDAREAKRQLAVLLAELTHADQAVRLAACEALGALGGAEELPALMTALLKAQSDAERGAAERAAAQVIAQSGRGVEACVAPVANALAAAAPAAQAALFRLLDKIGGGGKALAAVEAAAKDVDAEKRGAAVKTLLAWPDGAAAEAVLAFARTSGDESLRELARLNFMRLLCLPSRRDAAKSLELHVTGLEMAKQTAEKARVIDSLGRLRLLEALKPLGAYLEDPTLGVPAALAMWSIGADLWAAYPKEVRVYMRQLAAVSADNDVKGRAQRLLTEIEKLEGFITAWAVAGPYAKDGADVKRLLDEVFPPETPGAKDVDWKPLAADRQCWNLDLNKVFHRDNCAVYLRVVLESTAQEAILELGSDAGVKVWLNSEVVHANNVLRGLKPGEDKVKVRLKEGANTLLLKVTHGNGGGWGVTACLKKPDGAKLILKGAE